MIRTYRFYRGEMIEKNEHGWLWIGQFCSQLDPRVPVYKTLEDAKNAIRKHLDSTHKREPRIVGRLSFDEEKWDYVWEEGNE